MAPRGKRQIINGGFQDSSGNPLSLGKLRLRLNTDAQATGATGPRQVCAGIILNASLDSNGNVAGQTGAGPQIWPNDQLDPTDTVYIAIAYAASGVQGWKSENVIPSGTGPFDLNTWVPIY